MTNKTAKTGCLKGCLTLLTIFMVGVGVGGCVGIIFLGQVVKEYQENQDRKFALSLKYKVENNLASPDELVLYSEMLQLYNLRKVVEPNLHTFNEIENSRLSYLTRSAEQGSIIGTVTLAELLFNVNRLEPNKDTIAIKQKKVKEINRAVNLIATVLEKTCNADMKIRNLRYGDFYRHKPVIRNIIKGSTWLKRIENSRYNGYPQLQEQVNILFLRNAILCHSLKQRAWLSETYGKYLKEDELAFEFTLAQLTQDEKRINLIKKNRPEQPSDSVLQKADILVKAYYKQYHSP